MPCSPHPTHQKDVGKSWQWFISKGKTSQSLVFTILSKREQTYSLCLQKIALTDYMGILRGLTSICYKAKVLLLRTYSVMVGLAASQSGGCLTETSRGINLWLFTKDVLELVLHQVTGLDTFSGPFSP